MAKKFRIIIVLISISICLSVVSNAYSKYATSAINDINISLAKWQILLCDEDIFNNASTSISISPTIVESAYTNTTSIAPGDIGYVDIAIDPSDVNTSFNYTFTLDNIDEEISDLVFTDYDIISNEEITETNPITDNVISNDVIFDNETVNFEFTPFIVRIYFKWDDSETNNLNDEEDTLIGLMEDKQILISFEIKFKQIINQL